MPKSSEPYYSLPLFDGIQNRPATFESFCDQKNLSEDMILKIVAYPTIILLREYLSNTHLLRKFSLG